MIKAICNIFGFCVSMAILNYGLYAFRVSDSHGMLWKICSLILIFMGYEVAWGFINSMTKRKQYEV